MSTNTNTTLRRLIACSIVYLVWSLIATGIAIAAGRPAGFAGLSTRLPALQDFFYGMGTAMSPPFYYLVVQLVFTVIAPRCDRWGGVGVAGLTLFGLFSVIGALGEPILFEIFAPATFDLLKALIYAGMIVLPFATLVFGIREWLARRRDK